MRKFGFSFSWRRAIGLSAAKARLARQIGVPLTRAGQERRLGQAIMRQPGGLALLILGGRSALLGCFGRIVRLVVLIGLFCGAVWAYRLFKATASTTLPAASKPVPMKPAPEPSFDDILKQHS